MNAGSRQLHVLMMASNVDSLIIELAHAQVRAVVVTRTLSCLNAQGVELPPTLHLGLVESATGASSARAVRSALISWRDEWLHREMR